MKYEVPHSSLISKIDWDEETHDLTIHFKKYYVESLTYVRCSYNVFESFINDDSPGKFYLYFIKKHLKTKEMAEKEKPKTVNKASNEKRFIEISIDVKKIKKEWLFEGEKGTYLHMTLSLLPDGTVDAYGNLGMVTQKVPKKVYEEEKSLPPIEKSKGPILGNGAEFERKSANVENAPGVESGELGVSSDTLDDLPF